jgi:hypothetical protein
MRISLGDVTFSSTYLDHPLFRERTRRSNARPARPARICRYRRQAADEARD